MLIVSPQRGRLSEKSRYDPVSFYVHLHRYSQQLYKITQNLQNTASYSTIKNGLCFMNEIKFMIGRNKQCDGFKISLKQRN